MPPIMLTRDELTSLNKIVERARALGEIPDDHAEKFVNYGLAQKDVMILRATRLGQVELLRQRFRGIGAPSGRPPVSTALPSLR